LQCIEPDACFDHIPAGNRTGLRPIPRRRARHRAANNAFIKSLPFSDRADFDDAKRGFIATLPDGVIAGPGGRPAFDTKPYAFLQKDEVPATVNPSLWRQAQLNAVNGLFKVTERVYQVRGLDIANMTIIEASAG